MKVLVEVYDSCKYERGSKKVGEARYDIESFEVKQISDEEIYSMGFDEVDPYGEYLILTLHLPQQLLRYVPGLRGGSQGPCAGRG